MTTFVATTLAGVQWLNKDPFELANFSSGLTYSFLIMTMLASHELGHYFAARHHRVIVTLPFFIPFPSFLGFFLSFGTLGAVIRIRSALPSRKIIFDIGAAGPIIGFLVSLTILVIGFINLPSIDYLYAIHPEYAQLESIPLRGLVFGKTLIYSSIAQLFAPSGSFVPPMNEIYHYPFLCVGWFGVFVTAMNLIPIGQLDGGHISFAMFKEHHGAIAGISYASLLLLGLAGLLPMFGIQSHYGWTGWLFWALVLMFSIRVLKLQRPAIADETPLDSTRMVIGSICLIIFLLSFSITPFDFVQ